MKIKLKRKEALALLKLLGESEESDGEEETKPESPTDKDDPFPVFHRQKR